MMLMLPGGLELSYDEVGSGVPLLFIHGWPHDRTLWAAQLSGLPTYARCLAPDLRGFGDSSVTGPYSMDQYADDLAAFLGMMGIERAVVCGLSMGGYIALAMLRRHRPLLRGLVLVSTRATADTDAARVNRLRLIEFVEANGATALSNQQLRLMLGATTFASRPDMREAVNALMAAAPVAGIAGALRGMAERADSTDLLASIDLPTLVVSGVEDTLTPPDEMRAMASAIPRAHFESIEGAGHLCPYERAGAFNHVMTEFLGALMYD
ncbi:MAG: alpha/beta fold hydrolase [bacterium]